MLRAWSARGMRVSGLRMQLLRVHVRARTPAALVLEVTDRVAGGIAVPGLLALPRDLPTRHVVTLRQLEGEWRGGSGPPPPPPRGAPGGGGAPARGPPPPRPPPPAR